MDRSEKAIFTNMCMIYDKKGQVLVQDRRSTDWGGITFPGGHVEEDESFQAAVIREVLEETGLQIEKPRLCGIKQWRQKNHTRYIVLFYKTDRFSGELCSSDEGEVFWVKLNTLINGNSKLADGMDKMLEVFLNDDLNEFYLYQDNGLWKEKIL